MDHVGVVAEVDHLGRVHLPKKMREVYALEGEIEIVLVEDGILLRSPRYMLVERPEPET